MRDEAENLHIEAVLSDLSPGAIKNMLSPAAGASMNQQVPRAMVLGRAAAMLGGVPQLARRLNVEEQALEYWLRDIGSPPDRTFFDAIDVIIESAGSQGPPRE